MAKLGLGELYIVITDSNGDTLVGVKEDLFAPIVHNSLPRSLQTIIDDNGYILNRLMEAQRIVDTKNKNKIKDKMGKFVKVK